MLENINGLNTNRIKISEFPLKIDLGCGKKCKKGYIGFDKLDFGQEIVWDLQMGIPVPDDSVSHIYSSNFVEHLTEKNIDIFFTELSRICQNESEIEIVCPHDGTIIAYYTDHLTLWNEKRVEGICQGWTGNYGKFKIIEMKKNVNELFFKLEFIK
jgi:predicted SAM-dependent methyltransferase